ncbi:MAG TPA: aminotransferase class V-fold PLP-dependent enzyme [Candidatus Paceibacterota bacterium]|nr:aminotransferase class V-fold PLP-dependent enzyme [Candidatus Paceibacterota bacterium]
MKRERPISFYYATVAPLSEAALEAGREYLEAYGRDGSPEILFEYERRRCVIEGIAHEAATLLHCDPSEITFIPNTTYGINVASHALPLGPGDEIVVQTNEYKSNFWPWIEKRERDGCVVREIAARDNAQGFEDLCAAIGPATKAVAVSWIQYYDGFVSDLDRLSRLCREYGAYLVVDAVQGLGVRELDLAKTRIDILAAGGQKYLCAGPGGGILYVNRETMPSLRDTFVGIRSIDSDAHGAYLLKPGADRFLTGTVDMQAAVQLHAALRETNETAITAIESRNHWLLHEFKAALEINGIPYINHGERQGNIISLTVPDPKGLVDFLAEDRIYIKQIADVARLSFHHTSTLADFEELVERINLFLVGAPVNAIPAEAVADRRTG